MSTPHDYIPDSAANFRDWCANLIATAPARLLALGWTQARSDAFVAFLTKLRDAADGAVKAQQAHEVASAALKQSRTNNLPDVRNTIATIKADPGYDDALGKLLGIVSTPATLNPATYKPVLTAKTSAHGVELSGRKLGASSLNLYTRRKGEAAWRLLAAKRVSFPFMDDSPPATAGQPEEREYQAMGVNGDDEFGQPSNIATAVWHP